MKIKYISILNKEYDDMVNQNSRRYDFYNTDEYKKLPPFQKMICHAKDLLIYKYLDIISCQLRYAEKITEEGGTFHNFDFSTALALLHAGAYVTRSSWNGDDWYRKFVLRENIKEKNFSVRKYLMYCSLENIANRIDNSIIPIFPVTIDFYKRFTKEQRQKGENIMERRIYSVGFDDIMEQNAASIWKPDVEDIMADDWFLINSDPSQESENQMDNNLKEIKKENS